LCQFHDLYDTVDAGGGEDLHGLARDVLDEGAAADLALASVGVEDYGDSGAVHEGEPGKVHDAVPGEVQVDGPADGLHGLLGRVVVQLACKVQFQASVFEVCGDLHWLFPPW